MSMVLFFILGLIAGGLLCRRGPQGFKGERGFTGQTGPMGPPGHDSVDYEPWGGQYQPSGACWGGYTSGPVISSRESLRAMLTALSVKVDKLNAKSTNQ